MGLFNQTCASTNTLAYEEDQFVSRSCLRLLCWRSRLTYVHSPAVGLRELPFPPTRMAAAALES